MKFQLTIHAVSTVGFGLAAILTAPLNVFGQGPNYGPPATSYAIEASRYPDAASRPTPRMADGHPDLNGVWHHFFGIGTIQKVGENFVVGGAFSPQSAALYATPLHDPKPEYKPELVAKVKSLNDNQTKEDSTLHCVPPGVPRLGPPHEIVLTPKLAI